MFVCHNEQQNIGKNDIITVKPDSNVFKKLNKDGGRDLTDGLAVFFAHRRDSLQLTVTIEAASSSLGGDALGNIVEATVEEAGERTPLIKAETVDADKAPTPEASEDEDDYRQWLFELLGGPAHRAQCVNPKLCAICALAADGGVVEAASGAFKPAKLELDPDLPEAWLALVVDAPTFAKDDLPLDVAQQEPQVSATPYPKYTTVSKVVSSNEVSPHTSTDTSTHLIVRIALQCDAGNVYAVC